MLAGNPRAPAAPPRSPAPRPLLRDRAQRPWRLSSSSSCCVTSAYQPPLLWLLLTSSSFAASAGPCVSQAALQAILRKRYVCASLSDSFNPPAYFLLCTTNPSNLKMKFSIVIVRGLDYDAVRRKQVCTALSLRDIGHSADCSVFVEIIRLRCHSKPSISVKVCRLQKQSAIQPIMRELGTTETMMGGLQQQQEWLTRSAGAVCRWPHHHLHHTSPTNVP